MQRLAVGRFDSQSVSHVVFRDAAGQWWDACGESPLAPHEVLVELDTTTVDCQTCRTLPAYKAFLSERERVSGTA